MLAVGSCFCFFGFVVGFVLFFVFCGFLSPKSWYVVQTGLRFLAPLPLSPQHWDDRHVSLLTSGVIIWEIVYGQPEGLSDGKFNKKKGCDCDDKNVDVPDWMTLSKLGSKGSISQTWHSKVHWIKCGELIQKPCQYSQYFDFINTLCLVFF